MLPARSCPSMAAILPSKGTETWIMSDQLLLSMEQIDKRFPGVHALDHVDFDLRAGEVHILIGENGAGKSTLMKILSGSLPKDSGRILINGQEIQHQTPERAHELGIGMVYQELSLVPSLSVAENIFLGQLPKNSLGFVDWPRAARRAQEIMADLGLDISPQVEVRRLQVAEQQLTEIARILLKQPKILLLDEPTSALSKSERERLFAIIRKLRAQGVGIIYISHHLDEISLIGDRVTVMRDGKVVGTLQADQADEDTVIRMMVGRQLSEQFPKEKVERGRPLLQVKNLQLDGVLHDLSFELHAGEILGIFGLMGAGQPALARAIFGLEPPTSATILIDGEEVKIRTSADAITHGLGLLMRDRRDSLVPMLPISPNVTLPRLCQVGSLDLLNLSAEADTARKYINELRIQPPILTRAVMFLSGGNQQKVLLARWLHSDTKILILDEPTRGIDVGAKAEVYTLMSSLVKKGIGIIMISSEMQEILSLSDRILVMRGGRFTAEYAAGTATQEQLLRSASYLAGEKHV